MLKKHFVCAIIIVALNTNFYRFSAIQELNMNYKYLKSFIAILLSFSMLLNCVGCSNTTTSTQEYEDNFYDGFTEIDNNEITDAFVEITFNDINVNEIVVTDIKVNEIVTNSINIKSIENIEIEVVSANDTFVTLAHENFESYYGCDVDINKLLTDLAIGAGIIIVYVTLTPIAHIAGPVFTYMAAIVASEFTKASMIIGAVLDAGIAGAQAYAEGGDISYIVGHMLNGVADGVKWAALVAPVTGVPTGLKAIKATKLFNKLPGLSDASQSAAKAVFNQQDKIVEATAHLSDDASDSAIKAAYNKCKNTLSKDISEKIFVNVFKNKDALINITKEYNPFNSKAALLKTLRTEFWSKSGIPHSELIVYVPDFAGKAVTDFDKIKNEHLRNYILENIPELVRCYDKALSGSFWDSLLRQHIDDTVLAHIKSCIATDNSYVRLVEMLGKENIDALLKNTDTRNLLQARFGVNNLTNTINVQSLYQRLYSSDIPQQSMIQAINGIIDGSVKTVDDVASIDNRIAENLIYNRNIVAKFLNKLGIANKTYKLLDNITIKSLIGLEISEEMSKDIVSGFDKQQIISKYGKAAYDALLNDHSRIIRELGVQAASARNTVLMCDLTRDALAREGLPESTINTILHFAAIKGWKTGTEKITKTTYNIVADLYQATSADSYANYIDEYAEIRGIDAAVFAAENDITLLNSDYAGAIMPPTGENADFIKMYYGDIFMSQSGFPIFDNYAIARVELDNLTGNDSIDFAMANKVFHSSSQRIDGYTWHHLEDGKTLILIPSDLHEAYRHTGGASLIKAGINE